MLTLPSVAFFALVCPDLSAKVSPHVLEIGVVWYLIASFCLLATAFRDPGSIEIPQKKSASACAAHRWAQRIGSCTPRARPLLRADEPHAHPPSESE
jgi:hypothetical protein